MKTLSKYLLRTFWVIFGLFVILVIVRIPVAYKRVETAEQVDRIHATKLTLADVMGDNLPPDPGEEADKIVQGVDANKNGIRDDVELAIFKEYPNSAKIRAALLQYALIYQMYFTQPLVNSEIVIAVLQEESRANMCIAGLVPHPGKKENPTNEDYTEFFIKTDEYDNFVSSRQINTEERARAEKDFLKYIDSYNSLRDQEDCDINPNTLPG